MSNALQPLTESYCAAIADYLTASDPTTPTHASADHWGQQAIAAGLSRAEVMTIHKTALAQTLRQYSTVEDCIQATLRTTDFLDHALASFDNACRVIEADLWQSQQQLAFAFQTGRLGHWQLNCQTGDIVASDQCKANYGLPADADLSYERWINELVHVDDRLRVQAIIEHAITQKSDYEIEFRVQQSDGILSWLLVRGRATYGPDGTPIRLAGISLDISDRKQAELALQEAYAELSVANEELQSALEDLIAVSEELQQRNLQLTLERQRYQDLFDFAPDGYLVTDTNGVIQEANQAAALLLSVERKYLVGKPVSVFTSETDRRAFYDCVNQSSAMLQPQTWQLSFRSRQGHLFLAEVTIASICDLSGAIVGLRWLIRDITSRKQTESALKENEQFLRSIYEGVDFPIFVVDVSETQEFRCLGTNPSHERLSGFPAATIANQTLEQVFPAEVAATISQHYSDCVNAGKTISYEETIPLQGQDTHWVTTLTPLRDPTGRVYRIVGTSVDMTDRKRLEMELRTSEAKLRGIMSRTNASIACMYQPIGQAFQYYYISSGCELVFGFTPDEFRADPTLWRSHIFPDDQDSLMSPGQVTSAVSVQTEYRFYHKDGSLRWISNLFTAEWDETANHWIIVVVDIDITDRKATEEALRLSQERLRFLLTSTPVVFFRSKADGDYGATFITDNIEQIIGYSVQEYCQQSDFWISHVHPEDVPAIVANLSPLFEQGYHSHEYRFRHQNGNYLWMRNEMKLIRDEAGNPVEIIGCWIDITSRKEAELALQALNQELEDRVQRRTVALERSQADLQRREQELRTLVENSPDIIARFDRELRHVYINRTILQTSDLPLSEFAGKKMAELGVPIDIAAQCETAMQQAFQTGDAQCLETAFYTQNGTRWFETRYIPELDANGEIKTILEISREVTDRKRTEDALRQSEERYRSVIACLTEGIAVLGLEAVVVACNASAERILGLTTDQLLGRTPYEPSRRAIHDDGSPFLGDDHPAILTLRTGKPYTDIVMGIYRPDGELVWISINTQPLFQPDTNDLYGVVCSFTDITRRRLVEAEIRRSRALFEAVFEESADAIFLVDAVTGLTLNCNHRAVILFEAENRADLIGIKGQSLHKTPFSEEENRVAHESIQSQGVWSDEIEYQTRQGNTFWGSIASRKLEVTGGSVFLVRITDISDRKQAAQVLEQQMQREHLLRVVSQQVRQSLNLDDILRTTVTEVRQLLQADRVVIFRLQPGEVAHVIQESVVSGFPHTLDMTFSDEVFPEACYAYYCQGKARIVPDVAQDEWGSCLVEFMQQIGVKSKVVVPIVQWADDESHDQPASQNRLSGLLIVHACSDYRQWQPAEVDLLQQLVIQVNIAIQQANLYTQLENELSQKEVLLREIHHRVKNNLQIVSAMLSLQAGSIQDARLLTALQDSENRLQAMALIHEILYQSTDLGHLNFSGYIRRLADSILMANNIYWGNIDLVYQLDPVLLNLETAIPCGLLLNELMTNALKHAFPDGRSGTIRVSLQQVPAQAIATPAKSVNLEIAHLLMTSLDAVPRYCLTIEDDGIGMPDALDLEHLDSLGLKIAYDLARQLRGTLELNRSQGTKFQLLFSELKYRKRF
jgi:PAS domain S-box-containing protein